MPAKLPEFPERYSNRDEARRIYGDLPDRYAKMYWDMDPAADAVVKAFARTGRKQGMAMLQQALDHGIGTVPKAPAALKRFFEQVDPVPDWVDWQRVNHGARTYQRMGSAAGLILSAWSLMNGYHNGAAVKPLMFTQQLADKMAARRLMETGRFVYEVIQTNGLQRHNKGFKVATKVRLMHAMVRAMILKSGDWKAELWGMPINQPDMCGTVIEFSGLVLEGGRMMGFDFTEDEANNLLHLWRYAGHLSGVHSDLLFDDEKELREFAEMVHLVQSGPDEDSVKLAQALRKTPYAAADNPIEKALAPFIVRYHDGLTRAFNGDEIARDLQIPHYMWKYSIYPTRAVVGSLEKLRVRVPGLTGMVAEVGNRVFSATLERKLANNEPNFIPVPRLKSLREFASQRMGGAAA